MKKILIFIICLIIATILILGGGYFFINREIKSPCKSEGQEKVFEIRKGEGMKEIANNLQKEELIKNNLYFLFYMWTKKSGESLKPGKYCLSSSMIIPEIVQKLIKGSDEGIKITFPEGWRISEIEERLKALGLIEDKEISQPRVKEFKKDFSFLGDVSDKASLEGYLFPDTYLFYCLNPEIACKEGEIEIIRCQEGSIEEIIAKFLNNFDRKLTSDLREEAGKQQKSIFEIIIMASLLEKEVKTKEDREIVSGIFWKRIKEGKPLQSCATIAYILGIDKWRYSFEDTRIKSLYNTYLHKGLPPGPISNPGIESIRSAIFPRKSNYNYFLTDPETGNTIFAKTIKEHNQNKTKYFR